MKISIIQIPYDSGQFNQRMGRGPLHLTNQGIVNSLKSDGHDTQLFEVRLPKEFMFEVGAVKYIQERVKEIFKENSAEGCFPLILAGNCNYASFGTMSALKANTGVTWFDAHGDFNTPETSASGFFDGMALSVLTGNSWHALQKSMGDFRPVPEENVFLIGARDLDAEETLLLKKSKITLINAEDIRNKPPEKIINLFQPLAEKVEQVYVHIDLDVIDNSEFKANHFAVPNGLVLDELLDTISAIKKTFKIAAVSFTAYDPNYDQPAKANHIVKSILSNLIG
jgi:arginase